MGRPDGRVLGAVALVMAGRVPARGFGDRLGHGRRAAVPCSAVRIAEGGRLRPVTARHLREMPCGRGAPVHLLSGGIGWFPVLVLAGGRLSAAEGVDRPVRTPDGERLLLAPADGLGGVGYLHAVALNLDHFPVRVEDELSLQAHHAIAVSVRIGVHAVPCHAGQEGGGGVVRGPGEKALKNG